MGWSRSSQSTLSVPGASSRVQINVDVNSQLWINSNTKRKKTNSTWENTRTFCYFFLLLFPSQSDYWTGQNLNCSVCIAWNHWLHLSFIIIPPSNSPPILLNHNFQCGKINNASPNFQFPLNFMQYSVFNYLCFPAHLNEQKNSFLTFGEYRN